MVTLTRALRGGLALTIMSAMISCGGDNPPGDAASGPAPVAAAGNVVAVTVDGGPTTTSQSVNTLFTTVTFCVPGSTTECQTVDHIQVDTGSYGLRILASVLTLNLPVTQISNGNSLLECTQFVDGYSWGPVALSDVQISGEAASSVPIQVIGSANFTTIPDDCSSAGPTEEDTVATFGANGILGIGVFAQDCGSGCVTTVDNTDYYSCAQAADCAPTAVALASQVQNPVPLFATDNNGTLIVLPTVAAAGAATVTGSLIFGIDTQTNNASGSQTVLALDSNSGEFTTLFNGQTLSESFIDSGSNGLFFDDSAITACTSTGFSGFYCPASALNLTATMQGANNAASVDVPFSVGNAQTLATDNPSFSALPELAGSYAVSGSTTSAAATDTFDWGLPFYYGRRIATAMEGQTTAVGTGPYVAF